MPKNLHGSLDQLTSMQIKHKASCGELLDSFKHVILHLLLSVPVHGYVIQVDNCWQGVVARCTMQDTLNYKLEIGGYLCKAL